MIRSMFILMVEVVESLSTIRNFTILTLTDIPENG